MSARSLLILLTFCLLGGNLQGTITPIETLDRFEQALVQLDTKDLVLFDVDNVLLVPDDAVLRPVGKAFLKQYIRHYIETVGAGKKESFEELLGQMIASMDESLVDPRTPALVRKLQEQKIPTLAFTAFWSGKLGPIPNCAEWRVACLKKHGFHFQQTLPQLEGWVFLDGTEKAHRPLFKSGVLFSPHRPKGETLRAFLSDAHWIPKRIFFIDDREDYLKSVEAAAEELGVEFHGFHYTAVFQMPCTLDERIADLQLRHLVEHGEWLGDSAFTLPK